MAVNFIHPHLAEIQPDYTLIRDAIAGQRTVKSKGDLYLPRPNPTDTTADNAKRYEVYLERAHYYNVTAGTVRTLRGEVFRREPETGEQGLPSALDVIVENANGSGVSLEQLAQRAVEHVLAYGRGGFLADFPDTGGMASVQAVQDGDLRPVIKFIAPWDIINWRVASVGSRMVTTMVVIREQVEVEEEDGFGIRFEDQYRVLRLENGCASVEVWSWEEAQENVRKLMPGPSYELCDVSGAPMSDLPFTFIGSANNDHEIDEAPLKPLAEANIAHYRNSADYQESCFVVGQPTYVFEGLTESWIQEVWNGQVRLGSRTPIPLPQNATAQILQPEANSICYESMVHFEEQMMALGAKLTEKTQGNKTATEVKKNERSETSVLEAVSSNVSSALETVLGFAMRFVDASEQEIVYQLNQDFDLSAISTEWLKMLDGFHTNKKVTDKEFRDALRRAGAATQDDEDWQSDVEEAQQKELDQQYEEGLKMQELQPAGPPAFGGA